VACAVIQPGALLALALAIAGLAAATAGCRAIAERATLPAVPPAELRLRLVAAVLLAALILWSARAFGPVVSGVLLSLPVTGSIMPPFTLALYGPDALARLIRGFVVGLCGFTAFFFVVAIAVVPAGTAVGFMFAVVAALAAVFTAARPLRDHRTVGGRRQACAPLPDSCGGATHGGCEVRL
jgi:hypothetical protein